MCSETDGTRNTYQAAAATWVVNRGVVAESIINRGERGWQRNEVSSLQEIKPHERVTMKTSRDKSATSQRSEKTSEGCGRGITDLSFHLFSTGSM